MFSGIVEEVGHIRAATAVSLVIDAGLVLETTALGESIAVNGVCLTVSRLGDGWFGADIMPETVRRTNLGQLRPGDGVNLEQSLTLATRVGGHIVQGHIDGTGTIRTLVADGGATLVTVEAPPSVMRYVVEKGYIAVDGASLTVVDHTPTTFRVSLVRYTLEHTIFGHWKSGQVVNLEVDILAKYVERLLPGEANFARPMPATKANVWEVKTT